MPVGFLIPVVEAQDVFLHALGARSPCPLIGLEDRDNKDGLRVAALRAARPAGTFVFFDLESECRHMPTLV